MPHSPSEARQGRDPMLAALEAHRAALAAREALFRSRSMQIEKLLIVYP